MATAAMAGGALAERATPAAPFTAATVVSVGAAAAVLAVQLVVPGGWGDHAWVVLVAGLLAGLPHGAVDHLVPGYLVGRRAPRVAVTVAGYAAVAVLAWLAFRGVPSVALVVFVAVSILHFGAGEAAFTAERLGIRARIDPLAVVTAGSAALALPIVADPAAVAPVITLLVPGYSGLLPSGLVLGVRLAVVALALVQIVRDLVRGRRLPALEIALLVCLGLLVPPLAAFGVYFGAWHAQRHVARLIAADPANTDDLARGRLGRPLGRFARAALVPTAVSLAALLALWALADGWVGFVTANLSLLAGLTVPHVLMVAWWDEYGQGAP